MMKKKRMGTNRPGHAENNLSQMIVKARSDQTARAGPALGRIQFLGDGDLTKNGVTNLVRQASKRQRVNKLKLPAPASFRDSAAAAYMGPSHTDGS